MTAPSDITGIRLGRVVLSYLAMTVVVITLAPFRFSLDAVNRISFAWEGRDALMNVVMFVPLGFIYQLARRRGARPGWRGALLLGVTLSGAVECVQLLAPGRFPSLSDVVTNTAGAGLGAWLAIVALGRTDGAGAVRAFAVELPLMGIVYLLVPLVWLVTLGTGGAARAWSILLLAACAGWTISAVFSSFERAPASRVLLATAAWGVVALAPEAIASPVRALAAACVCLFVAGLRAALPRLFTHEATRTGASRRFEATTLRIVLPCLVVYLVLSALAPLAPPRDTWAVTVTLFPSGRTPSNAAIFGALERIAAFTLIGYAIAEYGGRLRDRARAVIPPVVALMGGMSAALEVARGWHPSYSASITMFALTLVGAGLGSWLYILQLAHVRALVGRPSG